MNDRVMLYGFVLYVVVLLISVGFGWCLYKMSDPLRGFGGSEVFTLIVGKEKKVLSVPKNILIQIPHFKVALLSGGFAESHSRRFELPEDSPEIIANIVYFTHSQRIPLPADTDGIRAYLRMLIVADKYQAESLANGMIDQIVLHYKKTVTSGREIALLREAGLGDSLLSNLLLRVVAWDMSHNVYKSDSTWDGNGFDELTKEEMSFLLESIMKQTKEDKDPLEVAKKEPCLLHTHTLTPVCR